MSYKPTVVFDLDGVIHSYTSGWKGASEIPDPPVPGMRKVIDELRERGYKVVVVSTRCIGPEGMGAVRSRSTMFWPRSRLPSATWTTGPSASMGAQTASSRRS